MLKQIGAALRISLTKCNVHTDPITYLFELNQVLNRYKSNLFKDLIKSDIGYDPKEAFQLRIATNWETKPGLLGRPTIVNRAPITLYISGFIPGGGKERKQLEVKYNYAVDVSDVINLERIAGIKTDYHTRGAVALLKDYRSEVDMIQDRYPNREKDINIYFTGESQAYEYFVFSLQINANVYDDLIEQHNQLIADSMEVPIRNGKKCGRKI